MKLYVHRAQDSFRPRPGDLFAVRKRFDSKVDVVIFLKCSIVCILSKMIKYFDSLRDCGL